MTSSQPVPPDDTAESGLYVARSPRVVLVRVTGLGTLHLAPVLQGFVQSQLAAGHRCFAVDLGDCTGLDSTFMGTLAGLTRTLAEQGGRLLVLNVNGELQRLLTMLGVWPFLTVRNHVPVERVEMVKLTATADVADRLRQIHDAHRQLVRLDARNRERFGRFLEAIETEMGAAAVPRDDASFSFESDAFGPDLDIDTDDPLALDDLSLPFDEPSNPGDTPRPR